MNWNNPCIPQQSFYGATQQMGFTPYQTSQINGRTVNDFNEITANDVPMNGGFAYFPKNDMSEIQLRRWTPQGTIETISFKPNIVEQPKEPTELELLAERVAKIEKTLSAKTPAKKTE